MERQNTDAIVALRMEVEQLKSMILTLQTQIDKVCNISDVPSKDTVDSGANAMEYNRSFGQTEVEVHADNTSSQTADYQNYGKHTSLNGRRSQGDVYTSHIQEMTTLLDAVLTYMQAPNNDLRNDVIAFAKRFREQVNKNGAV